MIAVSKSKGFNEQGSYKVIFWHVNCNMFLKDRLQLAWKQFFEPQACEDFWVLPRSTTFLLCDVQEKFRGVIDQMSGPRTGGLCRGVFIPSLFFVRI